jgi:hypothetical protein
MDQVVRAILESAAWRPTSQAAQLTKPTAVGALSAVVVWLANDQVATSTDISPKA